MMVVPDYRGFRIEVNAVAVQDRFNAEARVRRLFSREKPQAEIVTCLRLWAEDAERAGAFIAEELAAMAEDLDRHRRSSPSGPCASSSGRARDGRQTR
jgi:hypothetical protein